LTILQRSREQDFVSLEMELCSFCLQAKRVQDTLKTRAGEVILWWEFSATLRQLPHNRPASTADRVTITTIWIS